MPALKDLIEVIGLEDEVNIVRSRLSIVYYINSFGPLSECSNMNNLFASSFPKLHSNSDSLNLNDVLEYFVKLLSFSLTLSFSTCMSS